MRFSFIISLFLTKKIIIIVYIYYGDYMKRFKSKKRKSKKILILLVVLLVYIINNNLNIQFKKSQSNIIKNIFDNNINYSYKNNIINNLYTSINKKVFNTPVNILHTSISNENKVVLVSNISYIDNKPKVYIYNSHQGEKYSNEYIENSNIVPDVMLATSMLKEKLESIGIKTIIEKNDILGYMSKHGLDHGGSYIASRYFLDKVYKEYPNLDLYIDLHRDATTKEVSTTTINGKKYARVLFVIGLENKNYQKNLDVTNKINNLILKSYPNLTRGIMKKQGVGVNGVYNQDLNSNVILLEVGGDKNNIDEVNNTLDIIANIIKEYINEKEKI